MISYVVVFLMQSGSYLRGLLFIHQVVMDTATDTEVTTEASRSFPTSFIQVFSLNVTLPFDAKRAK